MNKLIRQYLPRSTNLENISDKEIYLIQEKINNRPRKNLNYLTPNEFIKSGAKKT
jgi:IS30 family transposase